MERFTVSLDEKRASEFGSLGRERGNPSSSGAVRYVCIASPKSEAL